MTYTPAGADPLIDVPANPLLILIDGHALVQPQTRKPRGGGVLATPNSCMVAPLD